MARSLQLYDKLLQFTLFQGISHGDLMQMVAHTKFGFLKFPPGKRIFRNGDRCDRLYFLINGCLRAETVSDDGTYSFTEEIEAPYVIQPERLFGIEQRFQGTMRTLTDVNFITIDKKEVANLSDSIIVFRLNLLNILAAQVQQLRRSPWGFCPSGLRGRIAQFVASRCQSPTGPKTVHILMERLGCELNASRLEISRALNAMQAEGLVVLSRGRIVVPALERLMASYGSESAGAGS